MVILMEIKLLLPNFQKKKKKKKNPCNKISNYEYFLSCSNILNELSR